MYIEYHVKVGAAALYQMQQKWECNDARQSTAELKRYEESKTKYSFKIRWAQVCFFLFPCQRNVRGNSCNCGYFVSL